MKLSIQARQSLQKKKEQAWLATASPFLISRITKKPTPRKERFHFEVHKKKKFRGLFKQKPKKQEMYEYKTYILSKKWAKRRREFTKKFGKFCFACDSDTNIHVHHMSYENLGSERDMDLAALCEDCHKEYHELNGVQRNMIKKTMFFIKNKQQEVGY